MRSKLSFKGIVIGGIGDIFLSNLLSMPFFMYVMIAHHEIFTGADPKVYSSLIRASASLYGLQLLLGGISSVVGGFLSATIARHDELLNGVLASFACSSIGIYTILSGKSVVPLTEQLLVFIAAPGCALLGGFIALKAHQAGR